MNAYEWTKENYPKIKKDRPVPVINYEYRIIEVKKVKKQAAQ